MRNYKNRAAVFALPLLVMSGADADIVHNDDVIITFSACVGNDCVNGESFGFDVLRLKENNLRIHFDDTSSSASFPANDWRVVINDSSNGGANYFAIEDTTAGRMPFRVDAGAPASALHVNNSGNIGIGTATPVVDIHTVSGNTPTLRLDQDGSSGFTPQTWDVAGNEAGFFIRDATNGSTLPFRIRPGARASSIDIGADSQVGIGTGSPDAPIDVLASSSSIGAGNIVMKLASPAGVPLGIRLDAGDNGDFWNISHRADNNIVFKKSGTPGLDQFVLSGSGDLTVGGGLNVKSPAGSAVAVRLDAGGNDDFWNITHRVDNSLLVKKSGTPGVDQLALTEAGDLTVAGDVFSTTCTEPASPCAPDYVFEVDYPLMTLPELDGYIGQYGHLPNVPSAEELTGQPVNVSKLQMRLLEKIEELTLYTLQQQETIEQLNARLASVETRVN